MADYSFVTIWRLEAPIDRVWELIDDASSWPDWWPSVLAVEEIGDPGAASRETDRQRRRFTMKGRLPYALRFEMALIRRDPPRLLEGAATGELEGVGRWTLTEGGTPGTTVARYDWNIRTTRWWMNAFAPLPFVDAIFRLNHHAVMRDGLVGIRRRLGVHGTYERVE